jgi:hypothetical protein
MYKQTLAERPFDVLAEKYSERMFDILVQKCRNPQIIVPFEALGALVDDNGPLWLDLEWGMEARHANKMT